MIVNFLVMLIFGSLGLVCHWFKRWSRRQTTNNFVVYMRNHRPSTITSVVTMVAAVFVLAPAADAELTMQTIGMAWFAGYTIDSAIKTDG